MAGLVYTPTGWVDDDGTDTVGTVFTAARMNNLEGGVKQATDRLNAPGSRFPIDGGDGFAVLDMIDRAAAVDQKYARALWDFPDLTFSRVNDAYTTEMGIRLLRLHFPTGGGVGFTQIGENLYFGRGPYNEAGAYIKAYIGFGIYFDDDANQWVNTSFAGNNGWTVITVDAAGSLNTYQDTGTGAVDRTYSIAAFKVQMQTKAVGYWEGDYQVTGPWSRTTPAATSGQPFSIPFQRADGAALAWAVQFSGSAYAGAVGTSSFTLFIDGVARKTSPVFYFNQTGVHLTMPTLVWRGALTAGTHYAQIQVNGTNVGSDGNDGGSIFITGPVQGGI